MHIARILPGFGDLICHVCQKIIKDAYWCFIRREWFFLGMRVPWIFKDHGDPIPYVETNQSGYLQQDEHQNL